MPIPSDRNVGAISITAGSLLLAAYAALFPIVLPIGRGTFDYLQVVLSRWWVPLTATAFIGVLLLAVGFDVVWSRLRPTAGSAGWIGFISLKTALILQACKLTWELFLDPIIAAQPQAAFLLRDSVIINDPAVVTFRLVSAVTILIGVLLFGVALYQSGEFPRKVLVLIAIGAIVYAIGLTVSVWVAIAGVVTLSVGCLLMGIRLWQHIPNAASIRRGRMPNMRMEPTRSCDMSCEAHSQSLDGQNKWC